ncbi:ABC transporter substrate-binding protein [Saccharobesus litoralis]|uniref:ABC transporter substrate-binding protein n=1 Tax=Saccharobesus litoralis TaxID=2172099 RepID=A0A2S0VNT5_9ALTE|nr:sialic acid TRAP transporter substrate-binding protein SiaP [Saccharobesus litoralis]AWB65852.1 ABC transporter substrate-binding protein [Saccharobesus litoralis]
MLKIILVCLSILIGFTATAKPQKLLWGHVYESSEPLHKWSLWAAQEINKQSNGRFEIDVFPISILGKEAELNESLSLGIVDIIYTGTSFTSQIYAPFAVADMPYMFSGYQHWQAFSNSDLFTDLANGYAHETHGNQVLGNNYYGERHLTSNKPVADLASIKGMKIRVPNATIFKMFPLAVNANPTPIAFSEVYMALQQNVVDAQENPLPTIKAKKFYEVQSDINLTGHLLGSILTIMSGRTWQALNEQDKQLFASVLHQAAQRVSRDTRNNELALIDWFKQQGVNVHQVDKTPFREATLKMHAPFIEKVGQDNYQRLLALDPVSK